MDKHEINAKLIVAAQQFQEAESELHGALARLRSRAQSVASLQYLLAGDNARDWMINQAYSNRAEWSGGPNSVRNIVEAIQRDAAINVLQRPPFSG